LVDAERLEARLERLERLLEQLEQARGAGLEVYLADEGLRAATERRVQLAIQACIDIGAQLVSEVSARPPTDYADVFFSLAESGVLDRPLAERQDRRRVSATSSSTPTSISTIGACSPRSTISRTCASSRSWPSA